MLSDGNYHFLAEVIDPTGDSSVTATSQTVAVGAPFVSLTASVGSVAPTTIAARKSGFVLVTLANTGNVIAAGKVDLMLGAAVDQSSPPEAQITTIKKSVKIAPGKSAVFRVRVKPTGILTPGTYYPTVALSLAGESANAVGIVPFSVG